MCRLLTCSIWRSTTPTNGGIEGDIHTKRNDGDDRMPYEWEMKKQLC